MLNLIELFTITSQRSAQFLGGLLSALCCLCALLPAISVHAQAPPMLWTHTSFAGNIAYSPTQPLLAAAQMGFGEFSLYNLDGTLAKTICSGQEYVESLAFSPDGQTLATGGMDHSIKLWRVSDGTCLQTLTGHTDRVLTVAFALDGKTLASGSEDYTVKLWNVNSGSAGYGTLLQNLTGHTDWVESVVYSPDGHTLASGSDDLTIRFWDANPNDPSFGNYLSSISTGSSMNVLSLSYSPDGQTLASGCQNNTIKLWQVSNDTLLTSFSGGMGPVYSVAFAPDGQTLACGCGGGTKLWDVSSGTLQQTLGTNTCTSVAYAPNGQTLAACYEGSTVKLWQVSNGTCLQTIAGTNAVMAVAYSPDGQTLATGIGDGTLSLWRVSDGARLLTITAYLAGDVTSVAFSPDGHTLASSCGTANTVNIWDVNSSDISYGTCLQTLTNPLTGAVMSVAFSPDGTTLAAGGQENNGYGIINLLRVSDGACLNTIAGDTASVQSVAFAPDGLTLASGSADNSGKLWRVSDGNCLATLTGHAGGVTSVAFAPDGLTLASASNDQTIRLWDVNPGNAGYGTSLQTFSEHTASVQSVAFAPDGQTLASASADTTIKIWPVSGGASLQTLTGYTWGVYAVAFAPNGQSLASGGFDGVALWAVSSPSDVVLAQVIAEVNGIMSTTVQVPITLTAQGDENALGGTIIFDPTILCNPQLTLGTDDPTAALIANYSQAATGLTEFVVALPAAQTFTTGTRQVAVLTFTLVSNSYSGITPVTFSNLPVTCEVIDANADYLDATWQNGSVYVNHPPVAANDAYTINENTTLTTSAPGVLLNDTDADHDPLTAVLLTGPSNGTLTLNPNGSFTYTPNHNYVETDTFTYEAYDGMAYSNIATVSITVIPLGYEGDVAPRPDGNGKLDIADWVQEGRYVAGLDIAAPGSEFMRADCAPLATKGDGHLTVADWVQVGRFVLGLDPLTTIGGPDHDPPLADGTRAMSPSRLLAGKTARALSIDAATLTRGKAGVVAVTLNALGNESALGFSVRFDAKCLKFVSAKVVGATAAATLLVNANAAAAGNLGVALMLPLPTTCKAGKGAVVEFTFLPLATGATPLSFSDQVVSCEIAGAGATALPANFLNSTVLVRP